MYVATAAKISSYPQFTSQWDDRVRSESQRRSRPCPCPEYTGFHTPEYCLSHHHWRPLPTIILVESLALKDTVFIMDLQPGSISLGCMWPKSSILTISTYILYVYTCVCMSAYKPVNPKGNQPWTCTGKTDAKAEAPILWLPDVKSWLIGKNLDVGKRRRGWQRWLDSITDWIDMNLTKLGDSEVAWCAAVNGVTESDMT